MPEPTIEVERVADGRFAVAVVEPGSESSHDVTITPEDLRRLGAGYPTEEDFVRACFAFLLAREPKESILRSFDVSVIGRYFPEFEQEIVTGPAGA